MATTATPWGQLINSLAVGTGNGSAGLNLLTGGLDFYNNYVAQKEASERSAALNEAQIAAIEKSLNLASQDAAYNEAMRQRAAGKVNELDATLRDVFKVLGPRQSINPADIAAYEGEVYKRNIGDLNQATELVSSQMGADLMGRGMDQSATLRGDVAATIAKRLAPQLIAARTSAHDEANKWANDKINTETANRKAIYGDYIDTIMPGYTADMTAWGANKGATSGRDMGYLVSGIGSANAQAANANSPLNKAYGETIKDFSLSLRNDLGSLFGPAALPQQQQSSGHGPGYNVNVDR